MLLVLRRTIDDIDRIAWLLVAEQPGRACASPATASARSTPGTRACAHRPTGPARTHPAHGVVQQERRGGPQADQRWRPRIATPARRHLVLPWLAGERIVHRDRADRRQRLVRLRREVVPDVAGQRIGRQRAAGVGLQQRHRHARFGRQEVAVEEVGRADDRAHLLLVVVGLGPGPVVVPALQVAWPGAAGWIQTRRPASAPCWNGSARRSRRTPSCRDPARPHPRSGILRRPAHPSAGPVSQPAGRTRPYAGSRPRSPASSSSSSRRIAISYRA